MSMREASQTSGLMLSLSELLRLKYSRTILFYTDKKILIICVGINSRMMLATWVIRTSEQIEGLSLFGIQLSEGRSTISLLNGYCLWQLNTQTLPITLFLSITCYVKKCFYDKIEKGIKGSKHEEMMQC